jgi:hypothetical protein
LITHPESVTHDAIEERLRHPRRKLAWPFARTAHAMKRSSLRIEDANLTVSSLEHVDPTSLVHDGTAYGREPDLRIVNTSHPQLFGQA